MTPFEVFAATYLLYARLGYLTDLSTEEVKPGDEYIREIQRVMDYLEPLITMFTGVPASFRPMLHFPLPELSPEERYRMSMDWEDMVKPFHLAGLKYYNGMPLVHAVMLADSLPVNQIEIIMRNVQESFKSFADEYMLAATQYGSNLFTLCFAYQQEKNYLAAQREILRIKDLSSFWRRTHTTCWGLDLTSFEICTSRGLANFGLRASNYLSDVLGRKKGKTPFPENKWQQFLLSGSIPPKTYSEYLKAFHERYRAGSLDIPQPVSGHLMKRIQRRENL
jgi:hypothetical protein